MELINDFKKLGRMEIALGKAGVKFDETLHLIAFNYLLLADNTGDIRPMNSLYARLTKGNQRALALWACDFGKFSHDKENNTFKFAKAKTTRRIDAEQTSPLSYEKAKKAPKKTTFDFQTALENLIAKAKKNNITGQAFDLVLKARAAA